MTKAIVRRRATGVLALVVCILAACSEPKLQAEVYMGVPEATEYLHELLKQRGVPHQFRAGNIHYSLEHEADVTAAAEDARSRYWPDYSVKPSYAEYNATILQMCDDLQLDCYEFTFAGEHRLAIRVPSDRQSVTLHDQIMAVILKRPLNMELVEPE